MEEMRRENIRLKKKIAEEELKKKKMKRTLDKYKEDQVIDRLSAIDAVKKTTSNSSNNDRGMQQRQKYLASARAMLSGKFLRVRKVSEIRTYFWPTALYLRICLLDFPEHLDFF